MLFLIKAGLVIGSIVGAYYLGKNQGQIVDKVRGLTQNVLCEQEFSDSSLETSAKNILESLDVTDAELADEIREHLFVFEDIAKFNDRAVQRILRETNNIELAVALKMTTEDVTQTIFSNISKRVQEMIKDDMEIMVSVRACDVEEAQQRIVDVVRKLEEEGEIIL